MTRFTEECTPRTNHRSPEPTRTASLSNRSGHWDFLADRVLQGHSLSPAEGLQILQSSDHEILDLLAAGYRIRRHWFGHFVNLNFLINAKSGNYSDTCRYCSQSCVPSAASPPRQMLPDEEIHAGAKAAFTHGAKTYCIPTSGLGIGEQELEVIRRVVPEIKRQYPLSICLSPGLLEAESALQLKAIGVDRVNHNLSTSERFYPAIRSTHSYHDCLRTLGVARDSGLSLCSGGVVGMGEEPAELVDLALRLRDVRVDAIPVHFLQPIAWTPLKGRYRITPQYCLKVLAMFRFVNPQCELRIAAGREMHLRSLQPLGLYVANSVFVGDYLTTKGSPFNEDPRVVDELGFRPRSMRVRGW